MKLVVVRKLLLVWMLSLLMLVAARSAFAQMASTNWAGYIINANDVTAIDASWILPAIQCTITGATNTVTQGLAVWIGFDGSNTGVIPEQIGTDSYCWNGSPSYSSWEEDPSISSSSNTNHEVTAVPDTSVGDEITASIAFLGNSQFQLSLKDSTSGESRTFTAIIKNAPRGSAEWIVEAFYNMNTGNQVVLPQFQPITFNHCSASVNNVAGSIHQNNVQSINMVDSNGNIIVTTQYLNQAGTSFQVAQVGSPTPEAPSVLGLLLPAFTVAIFILRAKRFAGRKQQ